MLLRKSRLNSCSASDVAMVVVFRKSKCSSNQYSKVCAITCSCNRQSRQATILINVFLLIIYGFLFFTRCFNTNLHVELTRCIGLFINMLGNDIWNRSYLIIIEACATVNATTGILLIILFEMKI